MDPRSGFRTPSTHSIVVVLPAPLGPIRPKISPWRTSNDTSSTATVDPYALRRLETSMTAGEMSTSLPVGQAHPVEAAADAARRMNEMLPAPTRGAPPLQS